MDGLARRDDDTIVGTNGERDASSTTFLEGNNYDKAGRAVRGREARRINGTTRQAAIRASSV